MFRIAILVLIFNLNISTGFADVKKPSTQMDTLIIMKNYVEGLEEDYYVKINVNENNLTIALETNKDHASTLYPYNLHQKLLQAENDSQREEILINHMGVLEATFNAYDKNLTKADLVNVMPVLRHKDYSAYIAAQGGSPLLVGRSIGDLEVLYALDSPQSVAILTEADIQKNNIPLSLLQQHAMQNLASLSVNIQDMGGNVYLLELDDFYESSFMLDTELWASLYQKYGELYLIAPNRNQIVFTPNSNEGQIDLLIGYRDKSLKEAPYPLSDYSYVWNGSSWKVVK